MRHTLICVSSLANLIQLHNLDLFNSAHMGSFAPRFHHNRFRVELVFEIMAFAAAALFPQFIGFLAVLPTGLSAIHKVSPPCLRRGLHGSVKRHASSPFASNSLAPWLPSSSPSCLHLLKSGSRNTASIHLVWGGRRRALAQLTVPARVTQAPHPSAVETRVPRTDSRTGLRPVEQQGPGGGSCQAET